jgi:hypothetical protein
VILAIADRRRRQLIVEGGRWRRSGIWSTRSYVTNGIFERVEYPFLRSSRA